MKENALQLSSRVIRISIFYSEAPTSRLTFRFWHKKHLINGLNLLLCLNLRNVISMGTILTRLN